MLGWPKKPSLALIGRQMGVVRKLTNLHKSALVFRPGDRPAREDGPLVIWWTGKESNGDLMLLLGHLLALDPQFYRVPLVLKSVVDDTETGRVLQREFEHMLTEIRIEAQVDVIVRPPEEEIASVIRRQSIGARLVLLGLSVAPEGEEEVRAQGLLNLLDGLTDTLLVRNAGPFRGMLVG